MNIPPRAPAGTRLQRTGRSARAAGTGSAAAMEDPAPRASIGDGRPRASIGPPRGGMLSASGGGLGITLETPIFEDISKILQIINY